MAMMHNVSKFRVLVVDDDADTVQSTAMLFEIDGFETQTALSGPEHSSEEAISFRIWSSSI